MARTYRFDVTVCICALSGQEDDCDLFKVILNDAEERVEIEQCMCQRTVLQKFQDICT